MLLYISRHTQMKISIHGLVLLRVEGEKKIEISRVHLRMPIYIRTTPDYGPSWTICSKIKSVQRALMNLDNPDELVYDSLISFFLEKRHLIGLITSDYNRNFSEFTWELLSSTFNPCASRKNQLEISGWTFFIV